ncbi:hypothetical protein [Bifidobacterium catulorum]|nr:hypothetical protein [Bifidobacterium catulorum]
MQSSGQAARLDDKKIAHVRALRRDAIRRRRILVLSLAVVAVVVLVLALALHFSPLFALIPVALDAAVLALGARASKQAREWEHMVAKAKKAARNRSRQEAASVQQTPAMRAARRLRHVDADEARADDARTGEDSATYAMSEQEIRRTIEQAKAEKQAALEAREVQRAAVEAANRKAREEVAARKRAEAEERRRREEAERRRAEARAAEAKKAEQERRARAEARSRQEGESTAAKTTDGRRQATPRQSVQANVQATVQATMQATVQTVSTKTPQPRPSEAKAPTKPVHEPKPAEPDDYTAELAKVSPSHPLDAFELASNQDLISFSLGSPRQGNEVAASEPQSREIKSTKQVAHAEPVKAGNGSAAEKPIATSAGKAADGKASDAKTPVEKPSVEKPARARQKAAFAKPGDIWQSSLARSVSRRKPRTQRQDPRGDAATSEETAHTTTAASRDNAVEKLIDAKRVERHAAQHNERQAARSKEEVAAPKASGDSLGTDVDAVLARRRG